MEQLEFPKLKLGVVIRIFLGVVAIIGASIIYRTITKTNIPSTDDLREYLKSNQLQVGTTVNNQYQQVYYLYEGQKIFVSEGPSNHTWARASGEYIVWLETPYQTNDSLVYLYNILSKTKTQLSFYGALSRPVIEGNKVVWEDHNGEKPAIYYYDGLSVTKLSDNTYPSVRPAIHANKVAYAQEIGQDDWRVVIYDRASKQLEVFSRGKSNESWPRFEGDNLIVDNPIY